MCWLFVDWRNNPVVQFLHLYVLNAAMSMASCRTSRDGISDSVWKYFSVYILIHDIEYNKRLTALRHGETLKIIFECGANPATDWL